jgi:hypothetical protein
MTGSKWRIVFVLAQLDTLSHRLARDIGYLPETKVDTRCDAAPRDQVSILHDAALFVGSADQRRTCYLGSFAIAPKALLTRTKGRNVTIIIVARHTVERRVA